MREPVTTTKEEWVVQYQTNDGKWHDGWNEKWGDNGVIRSKAEAIRVLGIFWAPGAKRIVHRVTTVTEAVVPIGEKK